MWVPLSLPPSLTLPEMKKRVLKERERERGGERIRGGGWRGGVGPYKSGWLQPQRRKKSCAQIRGRETYADETYNLQPRDPTGTYKLTPTQVRGSREAEGVVEEGWCDLWPLIQNLLHFYHIHNNWHFIWYHIHPQERKKSNTCLSHFSESGTPFFVLFPPHWLILKLITWQLNKKEQ